MSFAMLIESLCTTIVGITGCLSPINAKYAKHYYRIYFVFIFVYCMIEVCMKIKKIQLK